MAAALQLIEQGQPLRPSPATLAAPEEKAARASSNPNGLLDGAVALGSTVLLLAFLLALLFGEYWLIWQVVFEPWLSTVPAPWPR
jgi:hypothetical protein